MQLLNSTDQPIDQLLDQPLNASAERVLKVLEDVVSHIQIPPSFHFSHPRYLPLDLEPEIYNSLQQLSAQRQDEYLRWRLGCYLFSLYEAGGSPVQLESKSEAVSLPIQDEPVQNMTLGVHSTFYRSLDTHNAGKGYFDPGWQVLRQDHDGLFAVHKNGLTLHVDDRHLQPSAPAVAIGDVIAILLPHNRLEQGCYVALGNAGPVEPDCRPIIHLCFNLPSENMTLLMGSLTHALNALNIPFAFKVPYDPEDYDRRDSGVLSLYKADYTTLYPTLQTLYSAHQAAFRLEVPLFTKCIALGLGLAEQPVDVITPRESFAMHRFQAIAQGLIQAWRQNQDSGAARMRYVLQSFAAHHIDLQHPYLNLGAEDVYALLEDCPEATLS